MNIIGKNPSALVQIPASINENGLSSKYQISPESIEVQNLAGNMMRSQVFDGGDWTCFGSFLFQSSSGRKIVNHPRYHAGHEHRVRNVFVLLPRVSGNPFCKHCREYWRA